MSHKDTPDEGELVTNWELGNLANGITWDPNMPGLGIRKNKHTKVWVLKYRLCGKQQLSTIADCEDCSKAEARAIARLWKRQAKRGIDPEPGRRTKEAKPAILFASFAQIYLDKYAKVHKKSWQSDERRLKRYVIPALGDLSLSAITRDRLTDLHALIGLTAPYPANRVRELLSHMFRMAAAWGFIDSGAINPAKGIKEFREKSRDRWVTPAEMPRLMQALGECRNETVRAIILLILLTGLRKSEALGLKWTDVNLDQAEIHLEDTKSGRPLYLPLSEPALVLIKALPKTSEWLFPSRRADSPGHVSKIDKAWQAIRQRADLADVRIHDLRRTVGSWLAQSGESLHLIGSVLNQSTQRTTEVYARFGQSHVRAALDKHGEHLMQFKGDKKGTN